MGSNMDLSGFLESLDDALEELVDQGRQNMLQWMYETRTELGAEGEAIIITPNDNPQASENPNNVANVAYPSEEVRLKFEQIMQQKMS